MTAPAATAAPSIISTTAATTAVNSPAPSTPPTEVSKKGKEGSEEGDGGAEDGKDCGDNEDEVAEIVNPFANDNMDDKLARLHHLLSKSTIYAKIIGDKMEQQRQTSTASEEVARKKEEARRAREEKKEKPRATARKSSRAAGTSKEEKGEDAAAAGDKRKRRGEAKKKFEEAEEESEDGSGAEDEEARSPKRARAASPAADIFENQSPLVTGAKLKDYQRAGVAWLQSLDMNGLSGILADEMGLGKTLQTIAFLASLMDTGSTGPFLIVCPLSVLHNWISEFEKFTPTLKPIMYHGPPPHRAELRTEMRGRGFFGGAPTRGKGKGRKAAPATTEPRILVTTYEMCIKDRSQLSQVQWRYIVVDEGHRLKNFNSKLIKELKTYSSANRLILTGTPLHNNLAELWSLLNFILPQLFDDLDAFQQWFNFTDLHSSDPNAKPAISTDETASLVLKLHEILRPFLLRRLKVDVEHGLPPKKEYMLYAPLTPRQKALYDAIVNRNLRETLVHMKMAAEGQEPAVARAKETVEDSEEEVGAPRRKARSRKGKGRKSYVETDDLADDRKDDDAFEEMIRREDVVDEHREAEEEVARAYALKKANQAVGNMKLQNIVMQLRKVCSHPYLFDWPRDESGLEVINENLINASGKMLLLNRLLDALFARGHKVLVFSQFVTMLNIIEDWATEYKGWTVCRIDGSTSQDDRRTQMKAFNEGGNDEDAPKLFLLSTRAGGLGINLVAADTVIFFDSDWNPQMDLQAQDRAHRIGQTKPVLVYRLATQHTVETRIMQRANAKRKLESLVIAQGAFKTHGMPTVPGKPKKTSLADMAEALRELEGAEIKLAGSGDQIISDEELEVLLDRSPEAMERRKGWTTTARGGAAGGGVGEVVEMDKDEVSEGLARMMGDE